MLHIFNLYNFSLNFLLNLVARKLLLLRITALCSTFIEPSDPNFLKLPGNLLFIEFRLYFEYTIDITDKHNNFKLVSSIFIENTKISNKIFFNVIQTSPLSNKHINYITILHFYLLLFN
jgi:hypothetical protein